ncbi:reverse transcriptase-like protein [Neobacillus vireti]|uniref:reverse transcriptase-like protein n=1 Tax=Neobacillus vireti TaxID=220686 RepID=UPI002FFFB5EC
MVQKQKKTSITLLLRAEIIANLKLTKAQMNAYLKDGMPHYLIGNEYRFLESEVLQWLETYQPSQERLEMEFRDKQGRTIEEYVTHDILLKTLRIKKENLAGLCRKGMPFARVGEKDFFHVQDILNFYHKGTKVVTPATMTVKKQIMPLNLNVPKDTPFIILDGSYNFQTHKAGTGLVLVEDGKALTGITNVRDIKTTKPIVCEFLAILDALKMVKKKKFTKAFIITDQKAWSKNFTIDAKSYEDVVKPYIKEMNALWKEQKGKISIKFIGELTDGNKNTLYQKAHSLSKEYKKGTYHPLKIE